MRHHRLDSHRNRLALPQQAGGIPAKRWGWFWPGRFQLLPGQFPSWLGPSRLLPGSSRFLQWQSPLWAGLFRVLSGLFLLILAGGPAGCSPGGIVVRPAPPEHRLDETVIASDRGWPILDKVAVIPVEGILMNRREEGLLSRGENPVSLFQEKLQRAAGDEQVKAVVLRINSPGGSVAASDAMYQLLQRFRRETGKPVVASMLDLGCSGAYYLACGCDGIMAQPSTVTGSIGTIFQTISFEGTMQKLGIDAVAVKSGELKDMASPFRDLGREEEGVLREMIMGFYEDFLEVILAGRSRLTRETLLPLADGRIMTGRQGVEHGLVDRLGYPGDAVAWAGNMAGLKRLKAVMYHRPTTRATTLYSNAEVISPASSLVSIELPFLANQLPAGFWYLWWPSGQGTGGQADNGGGQ